MLISKTELKTVSVPEVVQKVINQDDSIANDVIGESEAVMRSYLTGRFDVDTIFAAEGDDRDKVIVKYLKDIVIHELYTRKTENYHEVTKGRYDEAMLWLEKVASGKIPAGQLPPKPVPEGEDSTGDGFIKFGGNTRYPSQF